MSTMQRTYSPVDGALLVERELARSSARERLLDRSVAAQAPWASTPLERRSSSWARWSIPRACGSALSSLVALRIACPPLSMAPGPLGLTLGMVPARSV